MTIHSKAHDLVWYVMNIEISHLCRNVFKVEGLMLYILTWMYSIKEVILHIIGIPFYNSKKLYYNRIIWYTTRITNSTILYINTHSIAKGGFNELLQYTCKWFMSTLFVDNITFIWNVMYMGIEVMILFQFTNYFTN